MRMSGKQKEPKEVTPVLQWWLQSHLTSLSSGIERFKVHSWLLAQEAADIVKDIDTETYWEQQVAYLVIT